MPDKTPQQVAELFQVSVATVNAWCASGVIQATNTAGPSAKRKRWRIADEAIQAFRAARSNQSTATTPTGCRKFMLPTKDYFVSSNVGAKTKVSSGGKTSQRPSKERNCKTTPSNVGAKK